MSGSVNKVILMGNVGQDPQIRSTSEGREIANLSIATTESWRDKNTGERKDKTEWHRIVVFSEGLVGVIKNYIKKGSRLYIEGALQTRKWVDDAGIEKYTTEIVLQNYNSSLVMIGQRNQMDGQSDNQSMQNQNNNSSSSQDGDKMQYNELDDEIPF